MIFQAAGSLVALAAELAEVCPLLQPPLPVAVATAATRITAVAVIIVLKAIVRLPKIGVVAIQSHNLLLHMVVVVVVTAVAIVAEDIVVNVNVRKLVGVVMDTAGRPTGELGEVVKE